MIITEIIKSDLLTVRNTSEVTFSYERFPSVFYLSCVLLQTGPSYISTGT